MITFRVGATDAEVFEKEFAPVFTAEDLVNLGFTQIYLKLMIDGVSSSPFSATSIGPIPRPETTLKEKITEQSRMAFARPRKEVEEEILSWHKPTEVEKKERKIIGRVPADALLREREQEKPEKPKENRPFERAFKDLGPHRENVSEQVKSESAPENRKVDERQVEKKPNPISLNQLQKSEQRKSKGPTQESVNALRIALAGLVKQDEKKVDSVSAQKEPEKKMEQKPKESEKSTQEKSGEEKNIDKKEKTKETKEVPEDELKRILGI
jgi:hypothetical protein